MSIGEQIPDVEEGAESEVNEQGLTAEEAAMFDSMRTGEAPEPAGGADAGAGAGAEGDAGGDDGEGDADDDGDGDGGADGAGAAADGDGAAPVAGDKDATGKDAVGADGKKQPPKSISFNKYQR